VPALFVAEPLCFVPPADAVLLPFVLLLEPEPEPPEVPVDLPPEADEVSVPFEALLPASPVLLASPLARGYCESVLEEIVRRRVEGIDWGRGTYDFLGCDRDGCKSDEEEA
jgi:hypothetical protein